MSTAAEIAAAFNKVDELLMAATDATPAVALLLTRAQEQGITEPQLSSHLHTPTPVLRWLLKLAPDATADRSLELDGDPGELLLRWARR
jgi:hypothetical protein